MNLNRIFETIRASRNVSYAINQGRTPAQRDLTTLGIADIFDSQNRTRKSLD